MLYAEQLRGARAFLRWDQSTVANRANVSVETVKRLERLDGALTGVKVATIDAIRSTLEAAGVEFSDPAEGVRGPGVALKWGVDLSQKPNGTTGAGTGDSQPGSQAGAWDDGSEDLHAEAAPADDPEIEELRAYWRASPEKWAALYTSTRLALLHEMELRRL
jgi:hypothetical protein